MSTELEKCEQQAKNLSLQERAILIRRLIEGLDQLEEQELEQLWIREAARRLKFYRQTKMQCRSAADVFADARARLQDMQ
ncbi:addiction module protein [Thermodesulfobacteriota bacterium B35]